MIPKIIKKAALAVFKDKKVLMVRDEDNEEVFYTLGGGMEEGETDIDCIAREVMEELDCGIDPSSLKFLQEFEGPADGKENTMLKIRLYEGRLLGEPKPSSDIVEIQYFDSTVDKKHLSETAITEIFPWLKTNNYIN